MWLLILSSDVSFYFKVMVTCIVSFKRAITYTAMNFSFGYPNFFIVGRLLAVLRQILWNTGQHLLRFLELVVMSQLQTKWFDMIRLETIVVDKWRFFFFGFWTRICFFNGEFLIVGENVDVFDDLLFFLTKTVGFDDSSTSNVLLLQHRPALLSFE